MVDSCSSAEMGGDVEFFHHFVTTLHNAFETELVQGDEDYEKGIESFNIPTSLRRAPRIYHVSMLEDLSLNPANFGPLPTAPEQHAEPSPHRYRGHSITHHQLVSASSDDENPVKPSE